MFNIFRKNKQENDPFKLDWGQVTPDQFNEVKNESFYLFNFNMISEEARAQAMKFAAGKILWYAQQMPKCKHHARLDIQGQDEIKFKIEQHNDWRNNTLKRIKNKQPKIDIEISIII